MQILVVMARYPFPPRMGSAIVAYNSIKHLSKNYRIDFIGLQPSIGAISPADFVNRCELVSQQQLSKFRLWIRYLVGIVRGVPASVSAFSSTQMSATVRNALARDHYDTVLLFEIGAIQYCPSESYRKLIINIEDPESIKLGRLAALPVWSLWQKAKLVVLMKLAARYERTHLPAMAKVLLLSESDMQDLQAQDGYDNLVCMPYGVEKRPHLDIQSFEKREKAIIFSGNMDHPPNVDGALFFLTDVFPLVLRAYPSAILWIVGANPDGRIRTAATKYGKQVLVTGRVDDIARYLKLATVSVCPVRLKIGVQTKILEALSWGTPVVTTTAGNSGIGGLPGSHLLVADHPQQFAEKIVEVLNGIGWSKLSKEGRSFVVERFSWEGSVANLERQIESLTVSKQ